MILDGSGSTRPRRVPRQHRRFGLWRKIADQLPAAFAAAAARSRRASAATASRTTASRTLAGPISTPAMFSITRARLSVGIPSASNSRKSALPSAATPALAALA